MSIPPPGWLIHTVTVAARTGVNANGEPTYAAQTTLRARVEKKTVFMRGPDGRQVLARHVLSAPGVLAYDAAYWFPAIGVGDVADDTSTQDAARSPVAIDSATNKRGTAAMTTLGFP